jgi:heptosyltransferase-1
MKDRTGMKILIVKLSAIGDVIHTLPALNAIRQHYPDAHITWLVEEAASDIVKNHCALDRIIISKRKYWIERLKHFNLDSVSEIYRFIKELRDTSYDLIIDFQALLKSGILIGLARGRRKLGFGKGMEHMEHSYLFLNERIPAVSMDNHALMRGMMLLNAIGIQTEKIDYHLPIGADERESAGIILSKHGVKQENLLIAINPVAKWETKLWTVDLFANLADRLIDQYNAEIIFTGSLEDFDMIQDIIAKMNGMGVNLAGLSTLKVLAALYEKADVVISTDTGPMHVAAAVETPVVALFGPTSPWRTGPFGSIHQVIRVEMECSPCFKRVCKTKECMLNISVDQVIDGVKKLGFG